ncbi:DNA packaging tegument protein UL17 [Gallid alphaherpesvirus 1]|uniref:DNA packaging tegument protein UL17 n=1 Tax=Infectious laryngotracheitis virus TaxID=10386 RepID=A0A0K0K788_ILTV|nr:DNA packaging tegument protein UL17 [Gallid alphaherpesvirus 1]
MEVHVLAATSKLLSCGEQEGGPAPILSHLVLSTQCLEGFEVPVHLLSDNKFYTEIQIRHHGCFDCTEWKQVFSTFVGHRALDKILLPELGNCQERPFRITYDGGNDWGGLFITIPVYCDAEKMTYDDFTAVAIRIAIGAALEEYYELLFTYGELVSSSTRYNVDSARLEALSCQLLEYSPSHLNEAQTKYFRDIKKRLSELLGKNRQYVISAAEYLSNNLQRFDAPPDTSAKQATIKERIDESTHLLKQVAGASMLPMKKYTPVPQGSENLRAVAQGLSALVKTLGTRGTEKIADARFSSNTATSELEPPGCSRGFEKAAPPMPDIRNVTMTDRQKTTMSITSRSVTYYTMYDCLAAACEIMEAENNSTRRSWSLGKISIVLMSCYNSGAPIMVVNYSQDSLKLCYPKVRSGASILATIMRPLGETSVQNLTEAAQQEIVKNAPCFQCPLKALKDPDSLTKLFAVDCEQLLLYSFQARVAAAFTAAVSEAIVRATHTESNTTRLGQLINYDIPLYQPFDSLEANWPTQIARMASDLMAVLCITLQSERLSVFMKSGIWRAILAMLIRKENHRRPYLAPVHVEDDVYLFDYFRFGSSNIVRITTEPVVLKARKPKIDGLYELDFIASPPSGLHPWTKQKFRPGEFHSYICVGFNSALNALLIFPGGFGLEFDFGEALKEVWEDHLDHLVLKRFSRRAPYYPESYLPSCEFMQKINTAG